MENLAELSTSSKDDYEDDSIILNAKNNGVYSFTHASKEGKLKTLPQDVSYASHFAGKSATEVYDRICSVNHFGHIANRILRKLIANDNLPPSCGSTLGKNRKVRAEQKQHFENLTEAGVVYLHNVIKQELEAEAVTDSSVVLPSKTQQSIQIQQQQLHDQLKQTSVLTKKNVAAVSSAAAANLVDKTQSSSSSVGQKRPNYEAMSKTELVELIHSAFQGGRHLELQAQAVAREVAEKAVAQTLLKNANLLQKQTSIKFLQDQLRDAKLAAPKKKEFETKLEELMANICAEM